MECDAWCLATLNYSEVVKVYSPRRRLLVLHSEIIRHIISQPHFNLAPQLMDTWSVSTSDSYK